MKKIVKKLMALFFVMVLLVVLFLALLTALEYVPDDIESLAIENNQSTQLTLDSEFSVMTFNIGYAGLGAAEDFVMDGGEKGRPDSKEVVETYLSGVLSIMDEYPMDFYLMQEVDYQARRSYRINQVEAIHNHLGSNFGYHFALNFKAVFVPFPVSISDHIGYVESGLQTLSNKQVLNAERHQFPGAFSWPLRIANLKRGMIVTVIPIENTDRQLILVNVHMSAYDDGTMREQEMGMLRDLMIEQYALGNYVIVGGDFNQTPPEAVGIYSPKQDYYIAHPIPEDYLPEGFSFQFDLTKPSCRLLNQPYDPIDSNTQYYIIDGFIVSDNISVEMIETIDHGFAYSDHNPVIMTVRLKP